MDFVSEADIVYCEQNEGDFPLKVFLNASCRIGKRWCEKTQVGQERMKVSFHWFGIHCWTGGGGICTDRKLWLAQAEKWWWQNNLLFAVLVLQLVKSLFPIVCFQFIQNSFFRCVIPMLFLQFPFLFG